jgi:hypothetical protein
MEMTYSLVHTNMEKGSIFCIHQKKNFLFQPNILVNFFNNIYPIWENSDIKQRSQKTFAYGDTFA